MSEDNWTSIVPQGPRIVTRRGYVLVYSPKHPSAKSKGHIYEHRMAMENHLERFLVSAEVVHHVNGDRTDNRLENLRLMDNGAHVSLHQAKASPELVRARTERLRRVAASRRKVRKMVECACGCGALIETPNRYGRDKRFRWGHNLRWGHRNGRRN